MERIQHDHKLDSKALRDFLEFTSYSEEEFWKITEKFINKDIWGKIGDHDMIGENAIVGACSFVTEDVPDNAIVGGGASQTAEAKVNFARETSESRSAQEKLPRVAYAGDREIAVRVLEFMMGQGVKPVALMIPKENRASHARELVALCDYLDDSLILNSDQFRKAQGLNLLRELKLDYIICVHFPYIFPDEVLKMPKHGVINLHPAYLPYNRGWHTPTWAIWEGTPYGATLHFMDEGIDTGDVIHQKQIQVLPKDTADTLYKRVLSLEFEVFKEAWTSVVSGSYSRKPQSVREGSTHKASDIASLQFIDLNKRVKAKNLIRLLRALTTNNVGDGAYFEVDGQRYQIQLYISKSGGD